MAISAKHPILDVWQGSDFDSGLFKLLCCGSKGYTWKDWYIPNIYSLQTFPYSEFTHGSATFKLKKKWSTIDFDVSVLCFIFFIPLFQTISVINKNGTCYFLHASKSWCMCWHVHVRLHTSNEEDCHWVTKEKKCFNLL